MIRCLWLAMFARVLFFTIAPKPAVAIDLGRIIGFATYNGVEQTVFCHTHDQLMRFVARRGVLDTCLVSGGRASLL